MSEEKLTTAQLDSFLQLETATDEDEKGSGYLHAAAALAAFDLFHLQPAGGYVPSEPGEWLIDHLLPISEVVTAGPDQGLWSLLLPQRRKALRAMGNRASIKAALLVNPDRTTSPLQRAWELLLEGNPLNLPQLSREQLAAILSVREWVDGILDELPEKKALESAIRTLDLYAPMLRLAGEHFVGREQELSQLANFVDGPKRDFPLYVFGSGGIGKSALLARFILTHALPANLLFGYVDMDRPTVRADQPLSLLLEIFNQVGWQAGIEQQLLDSLVKEFTYGIQRAEGSRHLESFQGTYQVDLLANVLSQHSGERPLILIIDTLEEAEFLGWDVMGPLMDFLLHLDRQLPSLRLILSGRILSRNFLERAYVPSPEALLTSDSPSLWLIPPPSTPINLGLLNPAEARQLLADSIRQDGLPALREEELDEVIGIVTRNPMCLKLAARLLRDEGIDKFRSAHGEVLARLKAEKVQALLYGRILGHLHTSEIGKEVSKVAYPGLVVRRITGAVIQEVLAGPCGLNLECTTPDDIVRQLANEGALVEWDLDGSLRHRVDVRRVMLEDLLDHVDKQIVDQIDTAAIEFYQKRPDPVSRAEELYHRLRQGQDEATLNGRWDPGASGGLHTALEELGPAQRLWLAEKLGVTLDQADREAADLNTWESQAKRSADRYLRAGDPDTALKVLRERPERSPRSDLYGLESEAYRLQGRFNEALAVARVGTDAALQSGAIDMALELLLRMAVIEEVRKDLGAAERLLQEAATIALYSANPYIRLRVSVTRLRIQRQLHPEARKERTRMREEISAYLTDEIRRQLRNYPVLLRELAAEMAKVDAGIVSTAIETLGAEVSSDDQAAALGRAIFSLQRDVSAINIDSALADGAIHFESGDFDPDIVRNWVTNILTSKNTRALGESIAAVQPGAETLGDFREYFRAGVEGSLRGSGSTKSED